MRAFCFMKIVLNGKDFEIEKELTIQELLERLSIRPERVAVEVNLQVIKKAKFQEHILKDGDRVEIVNFVGGGQDGRQAHYKGY
jgi:sulfur carrier protein